MEVLGAVAASAQLASLLLTISSIRSDLQDLNWRFQRNLEDLLSLEAVLLLINQSYQEPCPFQKTLRNIDKKAEDIKKCLKKFIHDPKKSIITRLLKFPSLKQAEAWVSKEITALETDKTTLILHLSAVQSNTLSQVKQIITEIQSGLSRPLSAEIPRYCETHFISLTIV